MWRSLRQTIIQQIYDDFPDDAYYDRYFPVKWLLKLSDMTLKTFIEENDEVWDDIPEHLLRFKRENPDAIIDPDMPPAREVVKAIRFLKQQHLPGSLLGEWQLPLPDLEVFRPPMMFPTHLKSRLGPNSAADGVSSGGGNGV